MSLVFQDSIASSTFWLVAAFLFISVLAIVDDLMKTKEELNKFKKISDTNYRDISTLIDKVQLLEAKNKQDVKPIAAVKKGVKVVSESSEEDDVEDA